jgi:hypothetical protein
VSSDTAAAEARELLLNGLFRADTRGALAAEVLIVNLVSFRWNRPDFIILDVMISLFLKTNWQVGKMS